MVPDEMKPFPKGFSSLSLEILYYEYTHLPDTEDGVSDTYRPIGPLLRGIGKGDRVRGSWRRSNISCGGGRWAIRGG